MEVVSNNLDHDHSVNVTMAPSRDGPHQSLSL